MAKFIKVVNDIFPIAAIEDINLAATLPVGVGVEVRVHGEDEPFQYGGPDAEQAYQALAGLVDEGFVKIATDMFPAERIDWINLNANFGGVTGVEVALAGEFASESTDGKPLRSSRQYTGEYATEAYNLLVALTEE